MPKLDLDAIAPSNRTSYPPEYAEGAEGRWNRRLGPVAGLTDFGANHVVLNPGATSSQRHWHEGEDELLVMISGAAMLHDDSGLTALRPGDICVFPKNDGNGHCIVNNSDADCAFVVVGKAPLSPAHYSDIDMAYIPGQGFVRKDGSAF